MARLQAVLLSGGSGTRLWPLSREAYPKQFLPLAGDDTMLQATWRRVAPIADRRADRGRGNEEPPLPRRRTAAPGRRAESAIVLEPVGPQHRAGDRRGGAGR